MVDDGSTDSSESSCNEYAEKDSRVKLISKENGGSASARQVALEASTGEYICACDADDWAEPDMFEKLYKKAVETGADIVMCDYWSEYPDGKLVEQKYPYELSERNDLLDDLLNGLFPKAIWNKLIRRDFLLANQLADQSLLTPTLRPIGLTFCPILFCLLIIRYFYSDMTCSLISSINFSS